MYYREIVHLVLVQESDFHLVWSFAPERNEDEINAHTRMKSPFRSCIEQHFYILILYINDIYILLNRHEILHVYSLHYNLIDFFLNIINFSK